MERDPVCGMNVDPDKAAAKVEHALKTYYFCAPGCAKRFQQAPETYVSDSENRGAPGLVSLQMPASSSRTGAAIAPAPQGAGRSAHNHPAAYNEIHSTASSATRAPATANPTQARYTCPMHPQIAQLGPGSCPICGMALEPVDVLAEVEADPEYDSMRLRFWVSAALSVPVLLIAMLGETMGLRLAPATRNLIVLALP